MGWFSKKYDPKTDNGKNVSTSKKTRRTIADKKQASRQIWGIKKSMVEFIIEASKDSYPNEFYAKLLQKNGVITEFSIIKTIQGRTHAIPFVYMEPPDIFLEAAGTIHSHPSGNNHPSEADLQFFSKQGSTHIIIGYPYNEYTWQAYNRYGNPIELEIVRRARKKR